MSWKVLCDGDLVYAPDVQDKLVTDISLDQEVSSTGALTFTLHPGHPLHGSVHAAKSIVTVYHDDEIRFRGRVIRTETDFYGSITCTCEGELAFLLDTVQEPFVFPSDPAHATPADYLAFLLNRHNAQAMPPQRLKLGRVTVTDPNDYIARSDTEYSSTWELVKTGLLDTLGGYLVVETDSTGGRAICYYSEPTESSGQTIRTDVNLVGLEQETDGTEIATAILPLGKVGEGEEEQTVTIASLPDDNDKTGLLIYSAIAEQRIGYRIVKVCKYDGITTPAGLARRARKEIADLTEELRTVTISAADLDGGGYKIGTYVEVDSPPHGLSGRFTIKKLTAHLDDPAQNTITVSAAV